MCNLSCPNVRCLASSMQCACMLVLEQAVPVDVNIFGYVAALLGCITKQLLHNECIQAFRSMRLYCCCAELLAGLGAKWRCMNVMSFNGKLQSPMMASQCFGPVQSSSHSRFAHCTCVLLMQLCRLRCSFCSFALPFSTVCSAFGGTSTFVRSHMPTRCQAVCQVRPRVPACLQHSDSVCTVLPVGAAPLWSHYQTDFCRQLCITSRRNSCALRLYIANKWISASGPAGHHSLLSCASSHAAVTKMCQGTSP